MSNSIGAENFRNGQSIALQSLDGWLYRGSDDPDWAFQEAPIGGWEPVSIGMFSGEMPEDWTGIGWLKTTIEVDSTLIGVEMGIQGRIYGAMELYINGELIGKAGIVGNNSDTEESIGYFEPFYFSFDDQPVHQITIQYSNYNYKPVWNQVPSGPLLTLGFAETIETIYEDRRKEFINSQQISFIQMGFFIALAMLHLILFWYYPAERANLIYGVMMIAIFIGSTYATLLSDTYLPENFIRYIRGEGLFVTLFSLLNIFFVYEITKRNMNWLPIIFTLFALPLFYLIFANPAAGRPFFTLYLYLSFLISIGFFARDRIVGKLKSLDIILVVYILYFIIIIPRTIGVAFFGSDFDFLWAQNHLLMQIAGFFIPIGYSVYLAKSVAVTNRDLQHKLEENEQLTAGKIRAEHEKQQIIHQQKEQLEKEVTARTADLKKSLDELKAAQEQLVQQEKLASLGQLTAGIAHEIKNPLNFVNNFSDLSIEMVEEARDELSAVSCQLSAKDTRQVKETLKILNDIEANLKKIHEHGSRADSIVKSMLQHSRGGTGKMEPTDLNGLVKDYVNLSFHGMRASKIPINVDIEMVLDEEIGQVPLIREDFSRVIVNLCNNAFDAMKEKLSAVSDQASASYLPKLTVRTKSDGKTITIEIEDNGPGIPDDIKDKILQPFFTTKKGTQGTGLGLSITNDIIKAHGGQLDIKTEDGNGSVFIITLPAI